MRFQSRVYCKILRCKVVVLQELDSKVAVFLAVLHFVCCRDVVMFCHPSHYVTFYCDACKHGGSSNKFLFPFY